MKFRIQYIVMLFILSITSNNNTSFGQTPVDLKKDHYLQKMAVTAIEKNSAKEIFPYPTKKNHYTLNSKFDYSSFYVFNNDNSFSGLNFNLKNLTTSNKAQASFRKWTFGYGIQLFWSGSQNTYSRGIKQAGFVGRKSVGGFLGGYETVSEPKKDPLGFRQNFYIEHLIRDRFSIGLLYTWFISAGVEGWDPESNSLIYEDGKGSGYYIYASRQTDRSQSSSLHAGLGIGAADLIFLSKIEYWLRDENNIRVKLSKWAPSTYINLGAQVTLFKMVIIGGHVQYWYIPPQIVDPFTINFNGFIYEFPEQKISFGGFSAGITIGFRPF